MAHLHDVFPAVCHSCGRSVRLAVELGPRSLAPTASALTLSGVLPPRTKLQPISPKRHHAPPASGRCTIALLVRVITLARRLSLHSTVLLTNFTNIKTISSSKIAREYRSETEYTLFLHFMQAQAY